MADPVDSLVSALGSDAFTAGGDDAAPAAECHGRAGQYKNRSAEDMASRQRIRRDEMLERQKRARSDHIMALRQLEPDDWAEEGRPHKGAHWHQRRQRFDHRYKHQLMLNEWLVDIPVADEFATNWLMVPCPRGKRLLLVATRSKNHRWSRTIAYRNNGAVFREFSSMLPAGTLLDCLYSEVDSTFYVIDALCWKDTLLADSETDCRFFILRSRMEEIDSLAVASKERPHPIRAVPYCECKAADMENTMKSGFDWATPLDGLMFYHRAAYYVAGETPLVGWLKPWMLPEVLHVPVPDAYLSAKPSDQTAREYITSFDDNVRDHTIYKKAAEKMEDADASTENSVQQSGKEDAGDANE